MDTRLYDLQQLHELSAGNPEFVERMVNLFIEMVEQFNERASRALISMDYNDLAAAAHKLKASVDMMGIESLHGPIRQLEEFCKIGKSHAEISDLAEEVTAVLIRVTDQLRRS